MKIMIITETFLPSTDGIVTRLTACIRWLHRDGHEVQIVAPDLGVYEFDGAEVKGVPARALPFYRSKKFALPNRVVKKYIQDFDPDVVHVVNPAVVGYSGVNYAKKLGVPLVASYHTNLAQYMSYYNLGMLKWLMWWYVRRLHNKADINLCTSQTVQTELQEKRFERMHLWKRGVDTEQFHPGHHSRKMRERLSGGKTDRTLLLYVGRLAAEKEIEKIRDVLEESDKFCLAIVGDGPHREELEKHFEGTDTVFTGFMHGDELASTFASSDVFVFPSTTETLGLVIMEAMASGLPLVAAESGPTKEQLTSERNGLLYDPQIKDDFKNTVCRFEDETLRKRLADQAFTDVAAFGWEAAAEQIRDLYKEAAGVKVSKTAENSDTVSEERR
ncbi:Glycosyltransferase involved in cell wall bisynthesis [Marinococcus luteus]|jgi:glycosyltransferase involved in cell wall biosynthesis|uniref:Glycosyltransferase involved in cell wall bisynthesis n=1 Tax=Marinococcus luteus TaxID=1122204 RepID=A0A1H2T2Z7_9BACI|nr:glycosyltransferase family 1 protein [Marinococcus luteus]SDW38085.1 Glycosyltransferase involved in cell wall bisynthesis [Marinococcus luteus]